MNITNPSAEIQTPMNNGNPPSRRPSFGYSRVRKLTLLLVLIFVLLMIIISIAWCVMDMDEPTFQVKSVSVSSFSVSNTHLRGKYEVELTIRNPNKKIEVVLDHFKVMVLYGDVGLSVAAVKNPVFLEKMANKTVKVELFVRDSPNLVHKVVPEEMVKEWNKGVVNFDVKMDVKARFEAGFWPSREKFLEIFCGDLDVWFSPKDTGKLLGIGKDCHPHM